MRQNTNSDDQINCYSRGSDERAQTTALAIQLGLKTQSGSPQQEIGLTTKARSHHLACFGVSGTGKTTHLLPHLALQDFKNKETGVTIIASSNDIAYTLYTLAKREKRRVHLLKPSINNEIATKLLWSQKYSYQYVNEFIINYKEAIRKREIVIIDMEPLKYKDESVRATAMLLTQLQLDLQETDQTQKRPHQIYIDDATHYLPFFKTLVEMGPEFNCGCTLFFRSRKELIYRDVSYEPLIEQHVLSTLYLNRLTHNDASAASNQLPGNLKRSHLASRPYGHFVLSTISKNMEVICFEGVLTRISKSELEERLSLSKRNRTTLLRKRRSQRHAELEELILSRQKELHRQILSEANPTLINPDSELTTPIEIPDKVHTFTGDEPTESALLEVKYEPSEIEVGLITMPELALASLSEPEVLQSVIQDQVTKEERQPKRNVSEASFQEKTKSLSSTNSEPAKAIIEDFFFTF